MKCFVVVVFCLLLSIPAFAINIHDTRLLTDPAVSGANVAFVYGNDIWLSDLSGGNVRRLTSHPGREFAPHFSPDGKVIAFSGQYEGNTDVYIVPTEGGVPARLTWHPGDDTVLGFTADGNSVLFSSPREAFAVRTLQLYTVPVGGGPVTKLPIPKGVKAAYSPDGKYLAYVPDLEAFRQWKNYRGGEVSRIILYDTAAQAIEQIPQPDARCNDTDPMWVGTVVYFRSDRNGEFNLFAYDPASKKVEQLTRYSDFPVLSASAGGGKIVLEQAGYLFLFDPAQGRTAAANRLKIGVAADLAEVRPRFAKGAKYIRNAAISPTGARAAFEFRGEIVTVPAEKGDDRDLTATPGINERSPAWSPDGKWIAYFGDRGGEYRLYIAPQDGKGSVRDIKVDGAGFYENPTWSPDSKKISYVDNSWSLYVVDINSEDCDLVATQPLYGPQGLQGLENSWSPDSRWLAYSHGSATYIRSIHLYSIDQKKSYQVTDGMSDVSDPVFDPSGKYIYFFASTDAGPVEDWFSMSNADMQSTRSIYLAVLKKGIVSPLAKESDEEGTAPGKPSSSEKQDADKKKADEKATAKPATPVAKVAIDFDGLSDRIQALPVPAGYYQYLQVGESGKIFYLKSAAAINRYNDSPQSTLQRYDLQTRKEETVLEKTEYYLLSADHKKVLLNSKDTWSISEMGDKIDPEKYKLAVDKIQVKIDPPAEWRQMFDEAWRINRDYFYDPNFHGADWNAMKQKYSVFLDDLSDRQDLNRVIQWMCSELSVGHHRVRGGDTLAETDTVPGGLLGADYSIENGRYRFKKVLGGLNWNPDLRSPLTEPGVDVKAGEYLLAVDGKDLRYPANLYSRFEQTSGRIVEITVGPNPDGKGSRTVKVVPIEDETDLRNRDWVESNLRKVTEATDGRVAYVYVPNTSTLGHEYFKRYFFPQADRQAIIVDERNNGGGQVADYYIDILRRPFISYWATRYGKDIRTPLAGIQGPKVMLIDQNAGSGGDLLPWMFHRLEMGTLIGKRTWGGLVGILGFPVLMDGGMITAPNLAIWTQDGGFVVENEGVPPDIDVDITPADLIAGHDPQLDKAIEVVLKQLNEKPPVTPKRPPYPVRVRKTAG